MRSRLIFTVLLLLSFQLHAGGKKKKKCTKQSSAEIEVIAKQVDIISKANLAKPIKDQFLYIVKDRNKAIAGDFFSKVLLKHSFTSKGFVSSHNLEVHFNKHKDEFGATSQDDYFQKAKTFGAYRGEEVLTSKRRDGMWLKMNPKTGEVLVLNEDGSQMITYYKADFKYKNESIRYYNEKIRSSGMPAKKKYVSLVDWFIDDTLNRESGN